MIENLISCSESKVISWHTGNDLVTKTYEYPVTAAVFGDGSLMAPAEIERIRQQIRQMNSQSTKITVENTNGPGSM